MPRTAHRFLIVVFVGLLGAALGGCNIVYKQSIQQGNVVDQDDLAQLEIGMTKRQVEVLLGSPALGNPFHADRWDYINTFAKRGGKMEKRILTVEFENGRVSGFYGNYLDGQSITGENPRDIELIDPITNQPVLPPADPTETDDSMLPTSDQPAGG